MVAAKDNFLGKYIYKDTLARNLAAVIYKVSLIIILLKILLLLLVVMRRFLLKISAGELVFVFLLV